MNKLFQSNQITLHEIYTRTELWKDKIYYISNNPYWNKDYQFLPLPQRFATILTEFRQEIDKQKQAERTEEERTEAQERINEIYKEIKELIEEEIEQVENLEMDFAKEDLPNWARDKQERIKQLKLGLNKKNIVQFRKFNETHIENNQEAINKLLNEWEEQKKIVLDRKNICFILQDTQDSFKFTYQPPRGNFPAVKDFLFYRNNIWYEVVNWERINHENVIITAQRSFFIHNYHKFFSQGANGVLHHSPKFGNKDEICQCPAFLESTEFAEFNSDWQPEYKLFKLKSFLGGVWRGYLTNQPYGETKAYPVFHTLTLEDVSEESWQYPELTPSTYFLLPEWYEKGHMTSSPYKKYGKSWFGINFINKSKTSLDQWIKNTKIERGSEYEHLLKHVHVNYFWGSKKIHESTLDDMDWKHFRVIPVANPAGTMYKFESRKVLFRYSEDLNFTLDADKLQQLNLKMGTKVVDATIKVFTGGLFDPKTGEMADSLEKVIENYIHSGKKDKSKDERQGERKKTLAAATGSAMQSVLGAVPSLLDASHTDVNYSLAELALRFESIQFKIRLEFSKNTVERYQLMKGLKKNGNEPFNTKKIGNILSKGYFKIVPNIFQGDKNGFFAGIFSKGVYMYEEHPNEYFLKKLEKGTFERGILNSDPVITNTTIQVNYTSAFGRDDQVHVDDMSWVWKDSYCRGAGKDLFPQLIEQGRQHIKKDDGKPAEKVYYKYQITSYSSKQSDFNTKKICTKAEWDKLETGKYGKGTDYDMNKVEYVPSNPGVRQGNEKEGYYYVGQTYDCYVNKITKQTPTADDYLYYYCELKDTVYTNYYSNQVNNISESEYNSLPHSYSELKVGDWWSQYYTTSAGAWKFDGYCSWSGSAVLEPNVKYDWYMHAFSSGQKNGKQFRGLDDGVKVILKQDGASWELAFEGRVEITETIGNPDAIGSGVEFEDFEEILPDMEDEKQTDGLDNLDKDMEPEEEQQKQQEIQDELEPEPEQQKQDEKQEELEQEDERTKEKTKEKQKQKQKEDELEDDFEYSGDKEK